jgi:hypothetical protein
MTITTTAFIKLSSDNTRKNYLGLATQEGMPIRFSQDYMSVEVLPSSIWNPSEEKFVDKAMRNQHLKLEAACTIHPKYQYRALVKTNPMLQEVASAPAMFMVESGEGGPVSFFATFRKDFEVKDLSWLVRIYLLQ